ncbi:MAG: LysE family translocator [Fibrobacter sp.]|uniref:LysE family translocator n=1 Tax=Fibrobacter sp. TaxID=35828 RepID=UPI001B013113|nr:LysE family translocator [Fibrobacter sp.]MBO7062199.1 LysE family translocator [Fibrobacter sp.]
MFEFFIAALVVAIAPGPDNLFVLAQSATHGTRAGICVICGLCTGIAVQTTLLIVGVSALIAASPVAFFVLQCCGAAYLLYLAYKSFQVRAGVVKIDERRETRDEREVGLDERRETRDERNVGLDERREGGESSGLSFRKLYLRGIIMNLTNPKAVLFALSFIPPAVRMDSALSPSLQMAILGVEFVVATFIVFGSIAFLAGTVKNFLLNSPKANRNLNWFSGCVFVLLAIALFVM